MVTHPGSRTARTRCAPRGPNSGDTRTDHGHDAVMAMYEDQLNVSEDTVRRLVDEQFPQWKKLALREVPAAGTVHAIFRIGDEFAARFLLRPQDPTQARAVLTAEAAAAGALANASTMPTPRAGRNR